ncbi:MAG TPA: hypothetical protein PLP42_05880 [Acidobacteriota bacterium]|nr:hypothetical protein [Acidobacteriota bacterium]
MKKLGPLCSCMALYGVGDQMNLEDMFRMVLDLFARLGYPPDTMAILGRGFSDKAVSFERSYKKLQKKGMQDVTAIDIHALYPDCKQPLVGWRIAGSINRKAGTVVFGFDETVRGYDSEFLDELAVLFRRCFPFKYGIAYRRHLERGPVLFAYGMACGLGYSEQERREAEEISRWFNDDIDKRSFLSGLLRDVFPQNWLTDLHLSVRVGSLNLLDWIATSPSRGCLRQLESDLWSWLVEPSQIEAVRRTLAEHGLLISLPLGSNKGR